MRKKKDYRQLKKVITGTGIVCLLLVMPVFSACSGTSRDITADLGEEVSLPVGRELAIKGEDLKIRFDDVTEDSRCPQDVTCIWEGRAIIQLLVTHTDNTYPVELTEPGLTDRSTGTFGDYTLEFNLEPYPVEGTDISTDDYYLQLTVYNSTDAGN
jgi:hypothetical protein